MSHIRRWGVGLPLVLVLSLPGGFLGQAAFAADRTLTVVEPTPVAPVVEVPPEPEPVIVPPVVEPEPEPEPPPVVVPPVVTPPVTTPPAVTPTTPPVTVPTDTPTNPPATTPVTPPVTVPTSSPSATAKPTTPAAGTAAKPAAPKKTTVAAKPIPVPATVYETTDTVVVAPSAPQIPVPMTTPAPANLWEEPVYAAGAPGPADTTAVTALLGSLLLLIVLGLALLGRAVVLRARRFSRPRPYALLTDEARLTPGAAGASEFAEFDDTMLTAAPTKSYPSVIGPPPPPRVL